MPVFTAYMVPPWNFALGGIFFAQMLDEVPRNAMLPRFDDGNFRLVKKFFLPLLFVEDS